MPRDIRWTTEDEVRFLKGLGTWRVSLGNREKLLQRYKASIRQRKNWDTVKPEAIKEFLWDV